MTSTSEDLWNHVIAQFACGVDSIHGPSHWRRVERDGLYIAERTGAIVEVVTLFALFHDSRRENEDEDEGHGERGAAFAASLRGVMFDLPHEHFDLLHHACARHTDGETSDDPTVGACWDADRLDLGRVGIVPSADYMSTAVGRELAARGPSGRVIR
ncbi:MAG TPA: hypothetical protein VEC56_02670 [Candidatus Krumholzibacteria bacterium]|nr:hypothetical protein [Candidatus Krumholzibacteria bacterium]